MTKNEIQINQGQYLSDVLKEIPTNTILNKTICGCGATSLEINAERNSIIIEPNVPVITGKKAKHDFICPVYEAVSKNDVVVYISGEQDGYRKIITTPEGFEKKVMPAMFETGINVYRDYFLLFDECERVIQDVGYRGDICLPIDDFFRFDNKAMVSATPIIPSDPRFEEHGFEMLRITPTYDYRTPLILVLTNNTVAALRDRLEQIAVTGGRICIFLNSTDTIEGLIRALHLKGRCKVFCSEDSVRKLKGQNFSEVSNKLGELAEINFFTSRFYSAVDIELDYKPHVIILSDVIRAPFSMIDPHTEVVQAIGRFRNGVEQVFHISNTSNGLQCRSEVELYHELASMERIYTEVGNIATENEIEAREVGRASAALDYHRFVNRDGTRNYFMWDNAREDENIKSYYKNGKALLSAYRAAPFMVTSEPVSYPIGDEDRLFREKKTLGSKAMWEVVIDQLTKLRAVHPTAETRYMMDELGSEFEVMVRAFVQLGARRIKELNYSTREIERALGRIEDNQLLTSEKMRRAVYERFSTGGTVPVGEVNQFMKQLIIDNGIPFDGRRVDTKIIKLFFETEERRTKRERLILFGKKRFEF